MTPYGLLNWAVFAEPFKNPAVPLPANVVTVPDELILRILWLPTSLTYKLSLESIVIPYRVLNLACSAEPFKNPLVPKPVNIERFPDKSILRIM